MLLMIVLKVMYLSLEGRKGGYDGDDDDDGTNRRGEGEGSQRGKRATDNL